MTATNPDPAAADAAPVAVGLIGAGAIGAFHGETLARRLPGVRLAGVADPAPGVAGRLAGQLGGMPAYTEPAELIHDPDVEAIVIAAPARFHAGADRGRRRRRQSGLLRKADGADPGRSRPGHRCHPQGRSGAAGRVQPPLRCQLPRRPRPGQRGQGGHPPAAALADPGPGGFDPARVPPWTIFTETLIHDFDALRYLNPGAEPAEVYAVADALVRPDFKDRGLLDTAVVMVRFSNGAIATAEASFQAVYGYDIRGEVFGSAGMVTAGDIRTTSARYYGAQGVAAGTWRRNIDLFHDAYVAQLAAFTGSVRTGTTPGPAGEDARAALAIALAAIRSVQNGGPVRLDEIEKE